MNRAGWQARMVDLLAVGDCGIRWPKPPKPRLSRTLVHPPPRAQARNLTLSGRLNLSGPTLTGRMEDVPLVRDALTNAVLNMPGRNPRQTKAFINLWRFYMVLDYELGYMTNSITATRVHSAEMARLVEIMVRWPWLLDALGARRPVGSEARPSSRI